MKWQGRRRSSNVEDRRGSGIKRGGGIGIIVLGLVAMYFGVDPKLVMDVGSQLGVSGGQVEQTDYKPSAAEQERAAMVETVLADTEDVWNQVFSDGGASYREPQLVMFHRCGSVRLRHGAGCHGTFLLPRRPESLYRPGILLTR